MVCKLGRPERAARNRSIEEHIAELRRRLAAGQDEIERQKAVVGETNEHLTGMRRWIEQTDRQLGNERERRRRRTDSSS